MNDLFPTDYGTILEKIDSINPVKYGYTRNYLNGNVTRLSPYISRGVFSTRMVLEKMLVKGFSIYQMEQFVKELCWRDYFQRVAQVKNLELAVRDEQSPVEHHAIPISVVAANTGIEAIDNAIKVLYNTGYMHNHCRMYTAFLTCNLAKAHWLQPARWMYYHLLDGDWASNTCSWQWVAGAMNGKKYYANQENINKYTGSKQIGSYIDHSYEAVAAHPVPPELAENTTLSLTTSLPLSKMDQWRNDCPTFIYNYYNLDPLWHKSDNGNRVLLLEPDHFNRFPISESCINFMLQLGDNIPQLQIFVGSFDELTKQYPATTFHFKEHPLNLGYKGNEEPRDWIAPDVTGYHPSFFSYWKKVEKSIRHAYPKSST